MTYLNKTLLIVLLWQSVCFGVTEDLTTYTEVDEGSDLTVTSTKVDISTIQMNRLSYVRRDMGSVCIGDFDIDFTCRITTDLSGTSWRCLALSDTTSTSRTTMDSNNTGIAFDYNRYFAGPQWRLRDEENSQSDVTANFAAPQTRYMTVARTGTALTAQIYTDSGRTTLEDTLSLTSGTDTYQYLYAFMNHNDDTFFPTNATSGFTENFELNSLCAGGLGYNTKITSAIITNAVIR